MILEEETFEVFGYEVWELPPKSNKPIKAACDDCGKVRTTSRGAYRALCRSCSRKGKQNALGCTHPHTEVFKANMSARQKGANNPNWRDGASFEPYCVKFNNAFKEYIRLKFEYQCFLCSKTQAENGRALDVHHVNYNKQCGCDESKCICVPLCKSCHAKTNGKRKYWEKKIKNKLKETLLGY